MIAGSQIIVGFFKNTTEVLIVEYHELHAVQEFKMSLSNLLIYTNSLTKHSKNYSEEELNKFHLESRSKLDTCKKVLTISHKLNLLDDLEMMMINIENAIKNLSPSNEEDKLIIYNQIIHELDEGIKQVDLLVKETKVEIEEYENRNKTVIRHGTITVIAVGIILILMLAIRGMIFIRSLTDPIRELVKATIRLGEGDRQARVKVTSNDEFLTLANSFNNMVEALDETTVSKDYFKNVIDNMFDALIVTDKNYNIQLINIASLKLLGYHESELFDQKIIKIFGTELSEALTAPSKKLSIDKIRRIIGNQNYFITGKGTKIPALISCTILKNHENDSDGLIIVGHDLTEKKAFEQKIDQNRKEQQIAINEAQEAERLRIATDLHDGLGQMLSAISFAIQDINIVERENDNSIINIQNQINAAIKEAKNISYNLIPIVLKDFGLIAAIDNMVSKANELYKTNFRFNSYDFLDRIDPKLEKAIYRICQESLTNIVKHAYAKNANFQLFRAQGFIVLVMDDDGKGFDIKRYESGIEKTGIGLISIQERVASFDGTFSIDSQTEKGTELIIEIPYKKQAKNEKS